MALPVLLRFRDLKHVGIRNWPSLKRRVEKDGFPAGRYIGGSRVWTEEEVLTWFNSRPKADPPPDKLKSGPLAANKGNRRIDKQTQPKDNESDRQAQPSNGHAS
jgi:hypothetical protein